MLNLIRRIRIVPCLLALYGILCLTSVLTGMAFGHAHGGPPVGYLWTLLEYFDHFAHSRTDAVLRPILIVLDYLLIVLFIPGVIASLLFLIVFIGAFLLLGAVFAWLVKLAQISLTGAIIVYSIVGITIAALLRKHWEAIMEAMVWVTIFSKGVWHMVLPVREPAYATGGHRFSSGRMGDRSSKSGTGTHPYREGGSLMSRSKNDPEVLPPQKSAVVNSESPSGISAYISRPMGFFTAKKHKIEAEAAAEAIDAETKVVTSKNRFDNENIESFHIETRQQNLGMERDEKTANQALKTQQAIDNFNGYRQERARKEQLPTNEKDLYLETVLKPEIKNALRASQYRATSRAEAMYEAALKKHELKQEVRKSKLSKSDKNDLYERINKEFDAMFAGEKKPADIPIYEEDE
jgi:hypothetical protein